jgi:hypothetical protein
MMTTYFPCGAGCHFLIVVKRVFILRQQIRNVIDAQNFSLDQYNCLWGRCCRQKFTNQEETPKLPPRLIALMALYKCECHFLLRLSSLPLDLQKNGPTLYTLLRGPPNTSSIADLGWIDLNILLTTLLPTHHRLLQL